MEPPSHTTPEKKPSIPTAIRKIGAATGLVLIVSAAAALMILLQRSAYHPRVRPGDVAPVLVVREPGASAATTMILEGRHRAILFFSVDCSHCTRELQSLNRLQQIYGDTIELLAVSLSGEEKTKAYIHSAQFTMRIYLDDNQNAATTFGVESVPVLMLVLRSQVVASRLEGEQSFETIRASMDRLLAALPEGAQMDQMTVLQDKVNTCGPAALKMILDHHKRAIPLREIERRTGLTEQGSSFADLKRVASEFGLFAEGKRLLHDQLNAASLPAILSLENRHFVVLDSCDGAGNIFVRDPAVGQRKISRTYLAKHWKGETLLFRTARSGENQRSNH